MKIRKLWRNGLGAEVTDFTLADASADDVTLLRECIYEHRLLKVKDQHLSPMDFVALGKAMGSIEVHYEPTTRRLPDPEVSHVDDTSDEEFGADVPLAHFWQADHSFTSDPFGVVMNYSPAVPAGRRGIYYLDMVKAFADLPADLQDLLRTTTAEHSRRRDFRIRPSDVGRPLQVLIEDIAEAVPSVFHPTVFKHPFTGEEVLYVNDAATFGLLDSQGNRLSDGVLKDVFERTGQLDPEHRDPRVHLHTFDEGDLVIWDNRAVVHRPLHVAGSMPAQSYRVAMRDDQPFFGVEHG